MFNSQRLQRTAAFLGLVVALAAPTPSAGQATGTVPAGTSRRDSAPPPPVESKSGLVVSVNGIASDVGAAILSKGGNAVDAAVATAFALAVVHPSAGNIGGGGFMVIRPTSGDPITIDYRERAPYASTP